MDDRIHEQMLFGFGTYTLLDEVDFFNVSGVKKFKVGDNGVESIRVYHLSGIVSVKIGETIRYFSCDFAAKTNFKEKVEEGNVLKFAEDKKDVKGIEKCFGAVQEI